MPSIPTNLINEILEQINKGLCVPFLGSGASAKTDTRGGFPLGSELADRMLKQLAQSGVNGTGIRNTWNLSEVATHYEHFLSRYKLINFLRDNLPDHEIDPLPVHECLAKLPFDLIITTNYDTLIEKALSLERKQNKPIVQPRGGFKDPSKPAALFGYRGITVYKMHGSIAEDEDNFIITEDDYLDMLSYMHKKDEGIPTLITGRFGVSTLLFLGYSLDDVDFKVLHKVIEKFPSSNRPPSYAIQKSSSTFAQDYWKKKDVQIYNLDLHEFMTELSQAYLSQKP